MSCILKFRSLEISLEILERSFRRGEKTEISREASWDIPGAHQMQPPSPLISWVNPFPSRFINRTACFPRKVSYFRECRMSPWKKKVGRSRIQKPVLRPFSFFTIPPFLRFYSRWDLGILKKKLMNYPTGDGTKAANWGSRKGYLCECFFLPLYIPHVSRHFEKSRRWSVLWTIWNFSMINAEKLPGSFDFCHHCGVDFASLAPRAKAMT